MLSSDSFSSSSEVSLSFAPSHTALGVASLNEQEQFWHGEFGTHYVERNLPEVYLASNVALFSSIFKGKTPPQHLLEWGANAGQNLHAIRTLFPHVTLSACEINPKALQCLQESLPEVTLYPHSFREPLPLGTERPDWLLCKLVLIHQPPEILPRLYQHMLTQSERYICIAEYYHPTPVEVTYRGHEGKLFKRDFAGELLSYAHRHGYPSLELIDYGFVYRGDPNFPQDDITWFVLKK
ncbi:MAG: pseudaminic acid biosynthesis-associated methylase [Vampirovibrionales bacterium]